MRHGVTEAHALAIWRERVISACRVAVQSRVPRQRTAWAGVVCVVACRTIEAAAQVDVCACVNNRPPHPPPAFRERRPPPLAYNTEYTDAQNSSLRRGSYSPLESLMRRRLWCARTRSPRAPRTSRAAAAPPSPTWPSSSSRLRPRAGCSVGCALPTASLVLLPGGRLGRVL